MPKQSPPKKPKPTVAQSHAVEDAKIISDLHNEIEQKNDQIDIYRTNLDQMNVEIRDLKKQLELALSHSQTNAAVVQELSHLKAVISPFVKSAKGEHTTSPEDWEALKGLAL